MIGGVDDETALEGVEHVIQVRVTNGGSRQLSGINVEAWVCDRAGGAPPLGALDPPARMTGFFGGPLEPGASRLITCSPAWTPTAAQVTLDVGRLCLAANAFADQPRDGAELTGALVLKPCCDTHHAERNVTVRRAPTKVITTVLPQGQQRPLSVPVGLSSEPQRFTERVSVGSDGSSRMWVAVVALGDVEPPAPSPPKFSLKAGAGPEAVVTRRPQFAPVEDGDVVAKVTCHDRDDDDHEEHVVPIDAGVFVIEVVISKPKPGREWALTIGNTGDTPLEFTLVAANDQAQSHQPWIDMARGALAFDAAVGEAKTVGVQVRNRGTGSLTISDREGQQLAHGFSLFEVPGPIAPGRTGDLMVQLAPQISPGTVPTTVYEAESNDATAQLTPGHSRRLTLDATVRDVPHGRIFVASALAKTTGGVLIVDPATHAVSRLPATGVPVRGKAVGIEFDGHLLVADAGVGGPGAFVRVDPQTGRVEKLITDQRLAGASGLVVQDPRTVLVLSHSLVLRVKPRVPSIDSVVDLGDGLRGIAVAPDTSFYVGVNHEDGSSEVLHVPRGAIAGEPVPVAAPLVLGHIRAIALEADGRLLIATALRGEPDPLSQVWGSIVRVDPATGAGTAFDLPDRIVAGGMTVDADGSIVMVTALGLLPGGTVLRMDRATGRTTRIAVAPEFASSSSLAVIPLQ